MLFSAVIVVGIKMQDGAYGAYALLACLPSQVCLPAGTLAACVEFGHAR